MTDFIIIGGAVADISLCPIDASVFSRASTPLEQIPMSTGGDAMNEASVLAKLGDHVQLCTLLGKDDIGDYLFEKCQKRGIDTSLIARDEAIPTSINIVLVDETGERRFITAADSSLRKLGPEHVQNVMNSLQPGVLVSFASIFVSQVFDANAMKASSVRVLSFVPT